ncbi:MAG: hypothetical protein AB2417_02705 [Clostridiaceae bacterium]
MEIKSLNINGNEYLFETLEQLIELLKDDEYEVSLNFKKKGKLRTNQVIL